MTLATSMDNRVTARTMSFVVENERLYFQTDTSFTKFHQIKSNPLVAVCWNNIHGDMTMHNCIESFLTSRIGIILRNIIICLIKKELILKPQALYERFEVLLCYRIKRLNQLDFIIF